MKKISFFFLTVLCAAGSVRVQAQNVGIGTTNPQQKLHVAGGLRVDTLSNGKDSGLVRHNVDGSVSSLRFSGDSTQVLRGNGTFGAAATASVIPFGLVTNPWLLGGNAGVTPATNFLGTTDNAALRFRINNQWAGHMDSVSQSTFLGYGAGKNDTAAAVGNTAMGYLAFNSASTGVYNTAMGVRALPVNTSGSQNTAIGMQALQQNTTGNNNVAVGLNSMNVNSSGGDNTAIGVQALNFNASGNYNVAVGRSALYANSTGSENIAAGHLALAGNSSGYSNVVIGTHALANCVNCYNTIAIGDSAMLTQPTTKVGLQYVGLYNTAVGSKTLMMNTQGIDNVAIGYEALLNNTTGENNVAVGWQSLVDNTTGYENVAMGSAALGHTSTGVDNVGIGPSALWDNVTGSDLTAVGDDAKTTVDGLTNASAFGSHAFVGSSNTIQLGNSATTLVSSTGNFVTTSDGRFKFNVQEDVRGVDFIMRLRPVSYQLDGRMLDEGQMPAGVSRISPAMLASYERAKALRRTGFIAQEVEKAAQDCGYEFAGVVRPQNERDHYSLNYQAFIMPMVKAMQEQQKVIASLQSENAELKKRLDAIEARLTK